ncbi:MAG TPA: hypothetical protein VKR58_03290, partial [Aquella sp.]|nr:hypothetical protein [Aquella sp.]
QIAYNIAPEIASTESIQFCLTHNSNGDPIPNNSYKGYYSNILIKGMLDYTPSEPIEIRDVSIEEYMLDDITNYNAKININDFLVLTDAINFLDTTALINYDRVSSPFGSLFIDLQVWNLYEGVSGNQELIISMWKSGKFFTAWQKFIYKTYSKFSYVGALYTFAEK